MEDRVTRDSKIRVLVVDDSTFIRQAIARMLSKSPDVEIVGQARNGEEAISMVKELLPDVMTLDIEMPRMNGLDVLEIVMREYPLPIIMVSSLTEDSAKETLLALELGAVDFISKQLNGSLLEISKIEKILLEKIRAASCSRGKVSGLSREKRDLQNRRGSVAGSHVEGRPRKANAEISHAPQDSANSLVIIGASTGGPKVIQEMLMEFPSFLPCGVIVVQHMPKFFTKPFAERLNEQCPLSVCEAKDGDLVQAGKVFVAPGGRHLSMERVGTRPQVSLRISSEPANLPYRPSVNLAMDSAVKNFGSSLIGVVLTGMGNDGAMGMQAIKATGGCTLVQNEETCIVYGMPKAVIDAGNADAVVPISRMTSEIMKRIFRISERNSVRPMEVYG
ncbi:MAG: chemotaxis response regulator protein-glutamate methylesterase [Nitrospirales bacterium]|nr:MAG: chemotaxis response regulator protein-glutamate methylesterase [Nitrospirales bacterium]